MINCSRNPQTLAQKILKADLHGCIIKGILKYSNSGPLINIIIIIIVAESKCTGVIGLEGIIVQETQNTFRIVSTDNRIKSEYNNYNNSIT